MCSRPVQPANRRKQLRVVQLHPRRRNLRPAALCLLKRLCKQARPADVPPNRLDPIRSFRMEHVRRAAEWVDPAFRPVAPWRKSTGVPAT
jgi:hypothetical protein